MASRARVKSARAIICCNFVEAKRTVSLTSNSRFHRSMQIGAKFQGSTGKKYDVDDKDESVAMGEWPGSTMVQKQKKNAAKIAI